MRLQIDRPDPDLETPQPGAARLRRALCLVFAFIAILWLIVLVDSLLSLDVARFGVRPLTLDGLLGLATMPLLHGGADHLLANSLPIAALGTGLLWVYPQSASRVLAWSWLCPALFVWLVGERGSVHIGASGLTFALLSYLSLGGIVRREAKSLALSMAVLFYYGSLLTGVLPINPGVSWQGHLGGLLVGAVLAIVYRRRYDIQSRRRYDWEEED